MPSKHSNFVLSKNSLSVLFHIHLLSNLFTYLLSVTTAILSNLSNQNLSANLTFSETAVWRLYRFWQIIIELSTSISLKNSLMGNHIHSVAYVLVWIGICSTCAIIYVNAESHSRVSNICMSNSCTGDSSVIIVDTEFSISTKFQCRINNKQLSRSCSIHC